MMKDRVQARAGNRVLVMDVAKRLADWRDQPPEQWLTALNRYARPGVTALLVLALAYQLATLTWTLVPGSTPAVSPPASQPIGTAPGPDKPVAVVPAAIDAPETTLSLVLKGILSVEGDPNGGAVIQANRGEDHNYRVGQTIEGADGATLHSVYSDRVLLNRNGRLETLRLPKELTASTGVMQAAPLPQAGQPPGGSLREVISQNATRLTDIMRLAPHVQEGQVVGFRVQPGRDRATFDKLGLAPGDVVTDINGTVLDDPAQGLQVFQSLGEATQANVTVLRDGVPQVVVIDTSQLQSLQENRE
jgi:general secretion pathway protein C